MSFQQIEPKMSHYNNPAYMEIVRIVNSLSIEANENLQSQLRMRNEIAGLNKEIKEIRKMLLNQYWP